jgi:hypothetical protein
MIYNSVTRLLGVPYAEAFKVFCTETAFLEMGMDYALRRTQEVLERVEAA